MKATLKYGVATHTLPVSGETCKRPYLTGQSIYDLMGVIEYALNAGYIRGQKYDLAGILNGCIDAVRELIKAGYIVDIDGWLQFFLTLTGQVGDDLKLTEANGLNLRVRALKDLTADPSDYTFVRIDDDVVKIKIDKLSSPNGNAGEWIKTKALVASGSNIVFNSAWGDKVVATWVEGEGESAQVKSLELLPSEQGATYLRFDWATGLAEVAVGTELALTFKFHGMEGGALQEHTKAAVLVAAA